VFITSPNISCSVIARGHNWKCFTFARPQTLRRLMKVPTRSKPCLTNAGSWVRIPLGAKTHLYPSSLIALFCVGEALRRDEGSYEISVTKNRTVFWNVVYRRFGGKYYLQNSESKSKQASGKDTRRHIRGSNTLHSGCYENLKSKISKP
jgi:hypothetical protein